jgi:CRISPR-associated endonuclease Cas3-HD
MYYAHSALTREAWEPLAEHLRDVGERTARFAAAFGAEEEGRLTGLLHDLGKYSDLFTKRLEGKVHGLDHWSAGAWEALHSSRPFGVAAALAIQGHHIGLQRSAKSALGDLRPEHLLSQHPLRLALTEEKPKRLLARLAADGIVLPRVERSVYDSQLSSAAPGAAMLAVRMLFSALVDADYLETEAHFRRDASGTKRYRPLSPDLEPARALAAVTARLDDLSRTSGAAPGVASVRADLLAACLAAADQPPGLFTLTAPTGAGKTLAMLAFALRHAQRNGMRRIVTAIPFLSILEQTAQVYREILEPHFPDSYLIEHHSLAEVAADRGDAPAESGGRGNPRGRDGLDGQDEARLRARWLTENWDAPLVVTTSVQLLESLFANRPKACRKLHRLAGTVVLLDEVQTLPPQLAVPTLAALSHLAERYGASVVFATATQPAFDTLDGEVRKLTMSGWRPTPVVPVDLDLFDRTRRVQVEWRIANVTPWGALADELAEQRRALTIVNMKAHAHKLAKALKDRRGSDGLFHISTNMCPAHRNRVLSLIRQRLAIPGAPCLVVSTQCIEAGVDVDFPTVYRALAPLDAIAQAAGRCNRNGLLEGLGHLVVFRPDELDNPYPSGVYDKAARVTELLLADRGPDGLDIQSAAVFRDYYEQFYALTGITDPRGKSKELRRAIEAGDFIDVAALYRLIDQDTINVLVPYDLDAYSRLRDDLDAQGRLGGAWMRRARAHTISLFRPKWDAPVRAYLQAAPLGPRKEERSEDWFVYLEPSHYDRDLLGLTAAPEAWIA